MSGARCGCLERSGSAASRGCLERSVAGRGCDANRGCDVGRVCAERRAGAGFLRRRTFTSSNNRSGAFLFLGDLLGGENSSGVVRPCQKL